jgi:Flp pilus assembly protein TadD
LYQRAVSLDPTLVDAHFNLALVLSELGSREEAEAAYRRVLDLQPDRATAAWNLGLMLNEDGRTVAARRLLNRAIELDPSLEGRLPAGVDLG